MGILAYRKIFTIFGRVYVKPQLFNIKKIGRNIRTNKKNWGRVNFMVPFILQKKIRIIAIISFNY